MPKFEPSIPRKVSDKSLAEAGWERGGIYSFEELFQRAVWYEDEDQTGDRDDQPYPDQREAPRVYTAAKRLGFATISFLKWIESERQDIWDPKQGSILEEMDPPTHMLFYPYIEGGEALGFLSGDFEQYFDEGGQDRLYGLYEKYLGHLAKRLHTEIDLASKKFLGLE